MFFLIWDLAGVKFALQLASIVRILEAVSGWPSMGDRL